MLSIGAMLLAILLLAALAEGIVEYFAAPWLDPEGVDVPLWRRMALRYVAALVGVGLCLVYAVDVLAMIGLKEHVPFVGQVMTGLLIGRGSNYLNDFIERWIRPVVTHGGG